ncbi:MAG TPA: NUDIX hydrolase [Allosphingosinicella sp.]|nr:NUDIX hydrolase [Allosphingosinicella sp.]
MLEPDPVEGQASRSDCVALLVADAESRLLVLWHEKYRFWTVPLGKIEPGETGLSAAHREAFEELGIVLEGVDLLDTIYKPADVDDYSDITITLCRVTSYSGTIANCEPDKHNQFRFVHPVDFASLEPLSFPARIIADRFRIAMGRTNKAQSKPT